MTRKPISIHGQARRDLDEAASQYRAQAGRAVARTFIEAVEETLRRMGEHPASGSPRYGHELNIPGLRFGVVRAFPHLVFYFELDEYIDVLRVLHGARDIQAWLRELSED